MELPDGWFSTDNIKEYRRLVENIPDGGTLCELGVWKGRSLCSVADIILRKNIRVIAVDTFRGTDDEGTKHQFAKENDMLKVFEDNMDVFGLDPIVYKMMTHDASEVVDEPIDLLFIDAGHSYEDVKQDIADWLPKVRGVIAGHDYSHPWTGVIKAVNERFPRKKVMADIWSHNTESILCYVSTCNRYDSTLPLCLVSIALQTKKPDHFILFDDNKDRKDLRAIEVYQYCFKLFDQKGISWEVAFGEAKGQHFNHEKANLMDFKYNWRIDDDEIAEATCLEELMKEMKPGIGAVGGLVMQPPAHDLPESFPPGMKPMIQWFKWSGEPREVDDLYSSFLYRPGVAHYDLRLSSVAHKEETMFTEMIKDRGFTLIATPKAVTWHFRALGGIRSGQDSTLFACDEVIYADYQAFKKSGKKLYVNNGGIGDNYMMLGALTFPDNAIIATAYPEVYEGRGLTLTSIANAEKICDIKDYDVYKWAGEHNWKGHLIDAYKALYS